MPSISIHVRQRLLTLVLAALLLPTPAPVAAQTDPTFDSAVYLIRSAVTVDRRMQFAQMIRSLRQLEDAQLKPLFREATLSENRFLRIHGILGLAEIDPKRQLDLTLLADVKDPAMQSELIGAALDSELIDSASAKTLLGWAALDMDAKVVIATHLLGKNEFSDVKLLKQAAETKNLTRQGVVGLLLTQLNDPAGPPMLDALDKSTDASRDEVRALLLQTAFRFKFDRAADWAAKLSTEAGIKEQLGLLGLRTAMRFGHKPSMAVWKQQFSSSADVADRMRLALSLLNLAPYVEPSMFDPIIASEDALLKQMGVVGKVAAEKKPVAAEAAKLIANGHAISNSWALGYATFHATPEDANAMFAALIDGYGRAKPREKAQRLDEAMVAAQALFEKDAKAAVAVLQPVLANPATDKQLVQGILIGLIRVTKGQPQLVVAGLSTPYEDAGSNGLKLLLQAKHGVALKPEELKDLALLIRGGASLPDPLRLQGAWAYLKQTKQADAALSKVLKG